ncbi:lasso peptide biosynthesis B2 protein [Halorubrum kocurii]|uniref:Microcin J25-processing protein McjB C-terminal domain-containing protein n=1 Tax=Halorubrum kocurii JCM 14978 TaxID=1230456 RepID=M0PJE6_9EURY|nr:lasso peptide biosynthesis B2 protein [Halorubrum kocurii]EMA70028.1 hypothetical protein C468_00795 [Halorubrum kocurii JCM 14978]
MTTSVGDSTATVSWSPGDPIRFLLAVALLLSLPLVLTNVVMSRTRASLLRISNYGALIVPGDPTAHRVVSAVKIADYYLPGGRTCLVRSLAAETVLRLYAFEPDHQIGVTTESDTPMEAHSWLEYRNEVLIGELNDLDRYEPLASMDAGKEL